MNLETETAGGQAQFKQVILQEQVIASELRVVQEEEKKQIFQSERTEKTQEKVVVNISSLEAKKQRISEIKVTLKKTADIVDDVSIMLFDVITEKDNEKTRTLFTRLTNALATLKGQLNFISEFLTLSSQQSFTPEIFEELSKKYIFLGVNSVPAKTLDDVCFQTLEFTLNFLLHVRLSDLLTAVHNLFQKEKGTNVSEIIDTLQIIVGKIEAVIEYIPDSVCFRKEDIFGLDKKGPRWETLHKFIIRKVRDQIFTSHNMIK